MNKSAKFWNKIASRYSKQPVADEASYQEKLRITQQYFKPHMEVLEIGCGTGSTAIAHASYVKSIQAIDFSPKMIEIAQNKATTNNIDNVTFKTQGIADLGATDQIFDMIMAHSILHLVNKDTRTIENVYDMLKNDGLFISSTSCLGDSLVVKIMAPIISIGAYFGLLPTLNIFTKAELLNDLQTAGFQIVQQWQPNKNSAVFIVARKV